MASDSGNGGGSSSQFLTSGSSALILAFLAIGLFVGGLLVMFAMRRYVVLSRRRAGLWEPAAGAGPWNWEDTTYGMEPLFTITVGRSVQRRQERGFGARPELLDVHAVKAASDSWEDIMKQVKRHHRCLNSLLENDTTPTERKLLTLPRRVTPRPDTYAPSPSAFTTL
ncbi:hypothetical protein TRAPUB_4077 [Trametes pubescens]|uniref:Uncharacterized protein n=1 Tax=Trametes pubescens TaxID=154538 RepID=A0A1M2VBW0_TRAPU|nr:hypothetical protein TRAPUB_4077 [Trametes pubescens]